MKTTWYRGQLLAPRYSRYYVVNGTRYPVSDAMGIGNTVGDAGLVTSVRRRKPRRYFERIYPNPFYSHRTYSHGIGYGSLRWYPDPANPKIFYGVEGSELSLVPFPGNWTLPAVAPHVVSNTLQRAYVKASEPVVPTTAWFIEAKESVEMLRHPLNSLQAAAHAFERKATRRCALARRGFKTAEQRWRAVRKAVNDSWLETQLGISPMIQAVDKQVIGLADLFNNPNKGNGLETFRASTRLYPVDEELTYGFWIWSGLDYLTVKAKHIQEIEVRCAVCRKGLATPSTSINVNAGYIGVVSDSWNAVKLSFAVDWIFNVGQVLKSCRPIPGGVLFDKTWIKASDKYTLNNVTGSLFKGDGGNALSIRQTKERLVNSGNPGTLELGPGLFSLSQGITAALLSAQEIGNIWRKFHELT